MEANKIIRILPVTVFVLASIICFEMPSGGSDTDLLPHKDQSQVTIPRQSDQYTQVATNDSGKAQDLNTLQDRINYAIGVNIIENIKKQGIDIDLNLVMKGMQDAFFGRKIPMTDEELRQCINYYQTNVRQKQAKARAIAFESNKKEGEAFLAENSKKEGVVTLPSGLQYRVIKAGEGKKPTDADAVECNYRGSLINGTEFDSSYRREQPTTLKVAGVITGLREALKLMPTGSTWQIFIPSPLAYGERGKDASIGPNETLIFEVELIAIK
jgi:FKBP-type peptidyl-prolyl cis-trans isomerase